MTDQQDDLLKDKRSYIRTGLAVAKAVDRLERKGYPRGEIGAELMTHAIVLLTGLPFDLARTQMAVYLETYTACCVAAVAAEAEGSSKH